VHAYELDTGLSHRLVVGVRGDYRDALLTIALAHKFPLVRLFNNMPDRTSHRPQTCRWIAPRRGSRESALVVNHRSESVLQQSANIYSKAIFDYCQGVCFLFNVD
jgi:hypothetical protein